MEIMRGERYSALFDAHSQGRGHHMLQGEVPIGLHVKTEAAEAPGVAGRTQRVQAACSFPESDRDEHQRDAALIAPFTPSFGGLLNLLPGTQHLRLRDLTAHMQRPCVADLKAC